MQTSPSEIQKIVRSGGDKGNLMVALVEARKRAENQQNENQHQSNKICTDGRAGRFFWARARALGPWAPNDII